MNASRPRATQRGFTLMELMVAMAITSIIVTVLVSITSTAIDTWSRSRTELRAARQAKAMVDVMANDFESLVTRREGDDEWLAAVSGIPEGGSTNAANVVFFTAATDRYEGRIGTSEDGGGDISCVGYQLQWADPIDGESGTTPTFVLKRHLVDPYYVKDGSASAEKNTFDDLLGKTSGGIKLDELFLSKFQSEFDAVNSFVCENIFQFTVVFHVETYLEKGGVENRLVSISPGSEGNQGFRIRGNSLVAEPVDSADTALANGRVTAVEVSLTVMTDSGVSLLRNDAQPKGDEKYAEWLKKNTYNYSKLIQLPGM